MAIVFIIPSHLTNQIYQPKVRYQMGTHNMMGSVFWALRVVTDKLLHVLHFRLEGFHLVFQVLRTDV